MNRNTLEQEIRETADIVPLRPSQRMYYVTATIMVPHEYVIAMPAETPEAACVLANEAVRLGKLYGVPNFQERGRLGVTAITSANADDRGDATKFEAVPEKYRHKRTVAGVTL